jgi:nicotinate-nucleotide pyrophosphorylase (carboxylating)
VTDHEGSISTADLVRRALAEDIGSGDVTTKATVPTERQARGTLLAKSPLVVAGLEIAFETFAATEGGGAITCQRFKSDGDRCAPGDTIAIVSGPARSLLAGERVALNFLQRLSGIATLTRRYVDAAAGRMTILDTRKTTPTLRALEKYAVRVGGGTNHRVGLFDMILIKDNHVRLAGGVEHAVTTARQAAPGLTVEIEAQTLAEVDEAVAAGADIILLDNLSLPDIREAVRRIGGRAKTEISGGVTLEWIPALASTGADFVSVGALTHSAPAADISFQIDG